MTEHLQPLEPPKNQPLGTVWLAYSDGTTELKSFEYQDFSMASKKDNVRWRWRISGIEMDLVSVDPEDD